MAVRPITLHPAPVLRARAGVVRELGSDLGRLVDDMVATMQAADGVGLAAPQVGESLRVLVYEVEGTVGHLVNPELTAYGDDCVYEEGCLSVPGIFADVTRPESARVTGQQLDGSVMVLDAHGFMARVLQHEVDHLDGVMFLDHLRGRERRRSFSEVRRAPWWGEDLRRDHLTSMPEFEDR